jgi:hypothetical protein
MNSGQSVFNSGDSRPFFSEIIDRTVRKNYDNHVTNSV